jgi:hypothetical protein
MPLGSLASGSKLEQSWKMLWTPYWNSPGVTSAMMVAGRYDFFVQYVCQKMEVYREFIGGDLRNVPGIADIESLIGVDLTWTSSSLAYFLDWLRLTTLSSEASSVSRLKYDFNRR